MDDAGWSASGEAVEMACLGRFAGCGGVAVAVAVACSEGCLRAAFLDNGAPPLLLLLVLAASAFLLTAAIFARC